MRDMRFAILFVLSLFACGGDDTSSTDAGSNDSGADTSTDAAEDSETDAADVGADAFVEDAPTDTVGDSAADSALDASDPCADLASTYVPVEDPGDPPFSGTLFISPDMMSDADPTSFRGATYLGQGDRVMFDRRTASFETFNAHLFDARYGTETSVEIQVNPEFSNAEAQRFADLYGEAIGRLPAFYFRDLETVWIHDGDELAGGGNNNILIHTVQGTRYIEDGILEELMLHEGAHTSLDSRHARDPDWVAAQRADGSFLSAYGRDNPEREDVAESIGPWLAVRFFRDRIPSTLAEEIERTIPNRLRYFDCTGYTPAILE